MPLASEPVRELTDRECAKLLGGTLGALLGMADEPTVLAALHWWIDNWDKAGKALAQLGKLTRQGAELMMSAKPPEKKP